LGRARAAPGVRRTLAAGRYGRALIAAIVATGLAGAARAAPEQRIVSLDQCADQYALKLAPRAAIAALSPRADDPDSFLRSEARGLPRTRVTLENVLAARPTHVLRYWGGSPQLVRALERRGVKVHTIGDAKDLDGVESETLAAGRFLGGDAVRRATETAAESERKRKAAAGRWRGERALYLTPGGYTSGPGTLIDAILRAAGLRNAARRAAFAPVSAERLLLEPPRLLVLGFFDTATQNGRWSPGRRFERLSFARERTAASLPGSMLGCPAWFAADAALRLGREAPAR
jgi:iron complex transport system substrate-binding protein